MELNYVIYETTTGRITQWGYAFSLVWRRQLGVPEVINEDGSTDNSSFSAGSLTMMQGIGNYNENYVSGGAILPRPVLTISKTSILANGIDEAVINSLPNPTTVLVDGTPYTVTDGSFSLTSSMAATYHIQIDTWPYQHFETDVVAT